MKKISRITVCLVALLVIVPAVNAQGSAGTGGGLEPRFLVDMPTAGMQRKGDLLLDVDVFHDGGVVATLGIGIFERLSAALSYGGSRLIGSGDPSLNAVPGVAAKLRVMEEGLLLPALAIGLDTQGKDGYMKDLHRYRIKSPGFYAVVSRNYSFLGHLSIHGGVNYSLERFDGDSDINFYAGAEKTIGPFLSVVVEYNMGLNDDKGMTGRGKGGLLNTAVGWSLGGGATLIVNFRDIAGNGDHVAVGSRSLRLEYSRPL